MEGSIVNDAIGILEQCGYQEELIQIIRSRQSGVDRQRIAEQIIHLNKVTPMGLKNYTDRARTLLVESMKGVNPFDSYRPEVPNGVFLKPGEQEFEDMEYEGVKELHKTGFVLIAGGLGERLGYSGIKLDLPVCTIETDYCYLKYYAQYILACYDRALPFVKDGEKEAFTIPFCIMTSDDTHERTIALLQRYNYFGLSTNGIDIVKQENVPALIDNNARFAIDHEKFKLITKPHGHGDIHNLLYDSGIAKKWRDLGKEWMVFIQDTNALAMKAIPSVLGVSRKNNWQMNTICVPRMPGESMGAICKLIDEQNPQKEIVVNVEYNQLDSLLRAKWNRAGDIKNQIGYSHFPGNTNTLVFRIPEYYDNLTKTGGVIPEFVNPKYANPEKTVFKSPTRLECMMQDYPKLLTSSEEVGFTMYETWYCFSPAKNNIGDAAQLLAKGMPSYGAAEAEYNFYNWTNRMLQIAGVDVDFNKHKVDYNGMQFAFGPKILMDPMFAITLKEIKCKFYGPNRISSQGSMILADNELFFENLNLGNETLVCQGGQKYQAQGCNFERAGPQDSEVYRIRGYKPQTSSADKQIYKQSSGMYQ